MSADLGVVITGKQVTEQIREDHIIPSHIRESLTKDAYVLNLFSSRGREGASV